MKVLKHENSKAYFLDPNGNYKEIDLIDKDALLALVTKTLDNEDLEFDEFDASKIPNPAQQVIYKNIHAKLSELSAQRATYRDRKARQFLAEYENYKSSAESDNPA